MVTDNNVAYISPKNSTGPDRRLTANPATPHHRRLFVDPSALTNPRHMAFKTSDHQ
jgi:hypothetical protein